ncbi:hypothetical protein BO99DRAFT_297494, partial [Aspergillus violaceofuscus CBS 115571]
EDCVHSLAFEGSRFREGVIERHLDGTCEWLFQSHAYSRWIDEHGLLLIRGNPGSGKSTLLKFALENQREAVVSTTCLVMSFFFYSSGTELQRSLAGLTRLLLLQLCEQDANSKNSFHEICRNRWIAEQKKNEEMKWHQNELQGIFERLVLECSTRRETTIFIDAVDECRDQDRDHLIRLFHRLRGRAQMRQKRPRVCFTCRLYPDGQINEDFVIRLEEKSQHDIQAFIEQELRLPDEKESAVNDLNQFLYIKANGIFLWLLLVIQQVHEMSAKGLSLKFIRSEISKCPQELDGLYEDLVRRIEDAELLEAGTLFQWVCFGRRPLSLDELRTAMTVHLSGGKRSIAEYEDENNPDYIINNRKMKKKMIHLSRGMIDIANAKPAEGSSLVGFYHETIKSFMLAKGLQYLNSRLLKGRRLAETADLQLANTCINYLSTEEICTVFSGEETHLPTRFFLLEYAATNWLSHAIAAERAGCGEHVRWPSQNILDAWVSICRCSTSNPTKHPERGTSLIHIAAEHGLERLAKGIYMRTIRETCIEALTTGGALLHIGNKDGWTPLHEASYHGHIRVCRLLLEHRADPDLPDHQGRTPLYLASRNGH